MSLSEIKADFVARLQAEDPSTPFTSSNVYLGRKYLAAHARGPKIVIVPMSGPFSTEKNRPGGNPRSLVVRQIGLVFFCFGRDLESTEAILHNAVRAARNAFHNSIQFGEEEWISEHEGFAIDGDLVSFSCMIDVPVRDVTVGIVSPPLNEYHTTEFDFVSTTDASDCLSPTTPTPP